MTVLRILPVALASVLLCTAADAAKLRVENHGVDSPVCGTKQAPCRSISQGIANAAEGDKILVGPGFYGDLDGDGVLGEAGEEGIADPTCACLVLVEKRVSIRSTAGAAATLLLHPALPLRGFRLTAEGSQVGSPNAGFTIVGPQGAGLWLDADGTAAAGNWLREERFVVVGADSTISDTRIFGASGNYAVGAGTRVVGSSIALGGEGLRMGDVDAQLPEGAPRLLERSVVVGNLFGVVGDPEVGPTRYSRSAVIGNAVGGIYVRDDTSASRLSLYGNGTGAMPYPAPNCGFGAALDVEVTRSFWGSPAGPGPDPADAACPDNPATIDFLPVSPKEIRVKLRPLR